MSKAGHLTANIAAAVTIVAVHPQPLEIATAIGVILAASAPDSLEMVYGWSQSWLGGREERHSLLPHRTLTHWPPLWLVMLVLATLALAHPNPIGPPWIFAGLQGVAVGALLHLGLDAFSPMGIPVLHPFGKRTTIAALYTTGSFRELLLLGPMVACAGLAWWLQFRTGSNAQLFAHVLPHAAWDR